MELLAIPLGRQKNGNQVAGYAALRKKFLAYIYPICGAAKFFRALHLGEL
jgi:hypothetical protein